MGGAGCSFLAALGGVAAHLGGASVAIGAARVAFWGAIAMGSTVLVGRLFGHRPIPT
jgi:vacuolar iron transporter family protein